MNPPRHKTFDYKALPRQIISLYELTRSRSSFAQGFLDGKRSQGPTYLSDMRELEEPAQVLQQILRRRRRRRVAHHQVAERVDDVDRACRGVGKCSEQIRAWLVVCERDQEAGMLGVQVSPGATVAGREENALDASHVLV